MWITGCVNLGMNKEAERVGSWVEVRGDLVTTYVSKCVEKR